MLLERIERIEGSCSIFQLEHAAHSKRKIVPLPIGETLLAPLFLRKIDLHERACALVCNLANDRFGFRRLRCTNNRYARLDDACFFTCYLRKRVP